MRSSGRVREVAGKRSNTALSEGRLCALSRLSSAGAAFFVWTLDERPRDRRGSLRHGAETANVTTQEGGSLAALRERNSVRLIDALRRHGTASRSDLARLTGLSRTTV